MDFKDILEQWEATPEGKKAAEDSRFSRMMKEKEASLRQGELTPGRFGYGTGKASLGTLKSKKPQAELDLHGITGDEARKLVSEFLQDSVSKRLQKVRIVHGRGLHSREGRSVLRDVVEELLKNSPLVRAYGNPPPAEGGTGAVWIILQRGR
jgi:DNA-nicking Smr family endonuclease